jgi:threonine dehydratase
VAVSIHRSTQPIALVTVAAIDEAARILAPVATRTPLVPAPWLAEATGAEVRLKCENLQRTGAFKFRGAFTMISRLSDSERARGVVCYSAGNHAQAVALSAALLGVRAVVVMPTNVVGAKRAGVEHWGAEVRLAGTTGMERQQEAERIAREQALTLIPPFADPDIIAGQGTVARELLEDWPEVEAVLVPTAGGGLLGGVATWIKQRAPGCRVVGVEPAGAGPMGRSLEAGHPVTIDRADTIADGLRIEYVSELTFAHARSCVDEIVRVTDDEIRYAMLQLLTAGKLVAEPAGAAPVAALLAGRWKPEGRRTAAILSGGNADPRLLAELLG